MEQEPITQKRDTFHRIRSKQHGKNLLKYQSLEKHHEKSDEDRCEQFNSLLNAIPTLCAGKSVIVSVLLAQPLWKEKYKFFLR